MKKKILLTGSCILFLAVLAGVLIMHSYRSGMAPDVTFRIIDGRRISMQDLQGRPVLVTFWATTCSTCLREMPHLISLYNDWSEQGLEVIGVAMAYDPPNRVLELARLRRIPYAIALDIDSSVARAFDEVRLTPTTILIAPDGRIVSYHVGELNMDNLQTQISELLMQARFTSRKSAEIVNHEG